MKTEKKISGLQKDEYMCSRSTVVFMKSSIDRANRRNGEKCKKLSLCCSLEEILCLETI